MISVSGNTFQFRAKEKRKVPQEQHFCARLLDWLRNLRKAVQEMTFVPAPMCPCQDRLSYLRSDHMLVRFLIARQLGTWSFAGPATDDNRCRSVPPPTIPTKNGRSCLFKWHIRWDVEKAVAMLEGHYRCSTDFRCRSWWPYHDVFSLQTADKSCCKLKLLLGFVG